MAIDASDLIHSSFRLIGAIAAGETLETTELADALVSLNQMISSWNIEGLTLAGRMRLYTTVTQTTNTYPMTQHIVKVDSASVAINGIDCPLEIVDSVGWDAITEKNATAILIRKLYCDYQYPLSTVYIWPTPRASGQLEMWTYAPIAPFPDLTTTNDLPPGYEAALRYNFAIAVLPEYPRSQVDPTLAPQAQMYKASIQQLNQSNHYRSQTSSPAQAAVDEASQPAPR